MRAELRKHWTRRHETTRQYATQPAETRKVLTASTSRSGLNVETEDLYFG